MGTKIYNSDLTKELVSGAKIQVSTDGVPSEIAEKVVPVMEVNPKLLRRVNYEKSGTGVVTGNVTIATTPTDQDVFLTDFTISLAKDATCDMATGRIIFLQVTSEVDGDMQIGQIAGITLTAMDQTLHCSLANPIKLKRNSNILLAQGAAYTVGLLAKCGSVTGYTVQNVNA